MKLLITVIFSISSFGVFTGDWTGEGYFYSNRKKGKCSEVFFQLKESKNRFEIVTGGYNCSTLSAEYPYSVFERVGDKLFYEGEEVGYLTKSELHLSYYDNLYQIDLILDGENLIFKEQWKDATSSLVIKSSLSRLND